VWILAAASERGICAITLGDDPAELVRELQDRFPAAQLVGGEPAFEEWVARVVGWGEAPQAAAIDLPLDVRGTAFQQRVWRALRKIPAGKTTTYSEIARRIGAPRSVRAVASAVASNRLAVAIPCHRVVRLDGSLSGYRWGVARKRALLERESARHRAFRVNKPVALSISSHFVRRKGGAGRSGRRSVRAMLTLAVFAPIVAAPHRRVPDDDGKEAGGAEGTQGRI